MKTKVTNDVAPVDYTVMTNAELVWEALQMARAERFKTKKKPKGPGGVYRGSTASLKFINKNGIVITINVVIAGTYAYLAEDYITHYFNLKWTLRNDEFGTAYELWDRAYSRDFLDYEMKLIQYKANYSKEYDKNWSEQMFDGLELSEIDNEYLRTKSLQLDEVEK
ncbi:hypothetical protein [Limnovirga soli]|uniref:Uncharacterized protein n=1 Tax=Limnovirga soli TaxID=2656915 RepID=A0A8J8JYD3_9BACT|nr:hypothetical protein [Limnovirga soli]NNV57201.1 hypothetical protein [Limnovirga soli]